MSNIKKILVPFDFTEPSIVGLEYALNFVGYDSPIQIMAFYASRSPIGANELKTIEADFKAILEQLAKRTKLAPMLLLGEGDMVSTTLKARKEEHVDLIIMGTLGDSSVEAYATHASTLVLHADCPVITVPFKTSTDVPKEIALVLGKEEIERPEVLALLLHIVRSFNARVHVLTIYKESIYAERAIVEGNEASLEYYLEHFYEEHTFEKNEDIEQGILNYIEEKGIDLLTILPRNHARKTKPSEGRLTKLLTLHSSVPVLTLD